VAGCAISFYLFKYRYFVTYYSISVHRVGGSFILWGFSFFICIVDFFKFSLVVPFLNGGLCYEPIKKEKN